MDHLTRGLALLGWYIDTRATSEDEAMLSDLAHQAIDLESAGHLDNRCLIHLSCCAFSIVSNGLVDPINRAAVVTYHYTRSPTLSGDINLVDESILSYYRGYYTAALSLAYAVLERYLRFLSGWTAGEPKPSFRALRSAVNALPIGDYRTIASHMIQVVYDWYNIDNPPPLEFNRHGLHHGLRPKTELDAMNFVRVLGLFDALVAAERGELCRSGVITKDFQQRADVYKCCSRTHEEYQLLQSKY